MREDEMMAALALNTQAAALHEQARDMIAGGLFVQLGAKTLPVGLALDAPDKFTLHTERLAAACLDAADAFLRVCKSRPAHLSRPGKK